MLTKAIARAIPGIIFSLIVALTQGQSRATCVYNETFQGGGFPTDWVGLPAQVARLDSEGNGTGEFTAPWQVGNAAQANAAGYFPVPDEPEGNTFVMANDDAAPCDCAMDDLSLFSPFYDLSGTIAPALSYRIYHDGRPFNGQARLEASTNGSDWELIEEIPAVLGAWQLRVVDLDGYSSGLVQFRFRYNDGGAWASGIAVDDICVFARLQADIALTGAWLGDATASAFNTSARSVGYSRMPLEQQEPLRLSARIRNNGLATATAVRVDASIAVDGGTPFISTINVLDSLAPLQDTLVSWEPGFLAMEAGAVTISLIAEALATDEESSDNGADLGYSITSSEEGNNTMASDNDLASTEIGNDEGFSAGCRFEMVGTTSTIHGISVRFGPGTQTGSRVNALLMDEALNLLSLSASHTITDQDLTLSSAGGSVYIPLDSTFAISQPQDVIALVRILPDSGAMRVACGGGIAQGAAFLVDAGSFLISYPTIAPVVRIHLAEPMTGLAESTATPSSELVISPNPATGGTWLNIPATTTGPLQLEIYNAQGRSVLRSSHPGGSDRIAVDVIGWMSGVYCVRIYSSSRVGTARLVVQ